MRNTFINELHQLAKSNKNIFLVVGDLGYSVVDQFSKELPHQFLNAGVAEQNMTGLAAGLALASSRTVFTYSIANFPTLRCLEQIRNDVCYHDADVKIISVGSGLAYGTQGYTHYGIEDVAIMRALPNIVVASPCDPLEAKAIAALCLANKGPWYVRLGKNKEPALHSQPPNLKVGEPIEVRSGRDGAIFSTGALVAEALKAANQLSLSGLEIAVFSVPFLKPLNEITFVKIFNKYSNIVVAEEHSAYGGLGSALSEIATKNMEKIFTSNVQFKFKTLALPEKLDQLGDQEFLRARFGIDSIGIQKAFT